MQLLKARCLDDSAPLLQYIDQMYVSGKFVQRRRQNFQPDIPTVNLRCIPARFPPELWNVQHATMNDLPKTNNLCEGWNNKFYHLVGYQDPSIWKLIRTIHKEEAVVSAVIARDSFGEPPRRKTKKIFVDLQQRLKNLCNDYTEGRKNLEQVLRGLGHNIRF